MLQSTRQRLFYHRMSSLSLRAPLIAVVGSTGTGKSEVGSNSKRKKEKKGIHISSLSFSKWPTQKSHKLTIFP